MIDIDDSMNSGLFDDNIVDDEFYFKDFTEEVIAKIFEGMEDSVT